MWREYRNWPGGYHHNLHIWPAHLLPVGDRPAIDALQLGRCQVRDACDLRVDDHDENHNGYLMVNQIRLRWQAKNVGVADLDIAPFYSGQSCFAAAEVDGNRCPGTLLLIVGSHRLRQWSKSCRAGSCDLPLHAGELAGRAEIAAAGGRRAAAAGRGRVATRGNKDTECYCQQQ